MIERGEILEVLARGELPVQTALARHRGAQPAPDLAGTGPHIDAQHPGLARRRLEQGGQHSQRRGLSRSVGSQKAENLARLDSQVNAVDGAKLFPAVRLPPNSLEQRPPAFLEDLRQSLSLDGRRRR